MTEFFPHQAAPPPAFIVHSELHADGATVISTSTGDAALAAGHLQQLTPAFGAIKGASGFIRCPVSWALVVQLASHLGPARWAPGPRLQEWVGTAAAARGALPELKARVNAGAPEPRDYQIAGAQMIAAAGSAVLADDAGTGKTLTALLGLLELQERDKLTGPILVIAPNSVMDAWIAAAHRWTPLRAVAWRGHPLDREALIGTADLYVCAYSIIVRDCPPTKKRGSGPLNHLRPQAVVIDETHLIKNENAARSQSVRRLSHDADFVIGLGATPITHGIEGLFSLLNSMDPGAFPSKERFVRRYLETAEGDYSSRTLGLKEHITPEFRRVLHGQFRRLSKEDVLSQLPPKIYSTRVVQMPGPARAAYEGMRDDMLAALPDGGELNAMSVLSQLTRLLQLASASADVSVRELEEFDEETGEPKVEVNVTLREPSWKVDELIEVLAERPGRQTMVFAPSAQLIRIAGARAEREGYRVGYVIGGQRPAERTAAVDAFQAGELDVILLTTAAGGVGLTLTAASTVVGLLRPWSFVESSQVEDRAHRIGSEVHDSIEIIDIVAADTIDEDVRAIVRAKASSLAELLDDDRVVAGALGGHEVQARLDRAVKTLVRDPEQVRALLQKKG